MRIPLLPLPKIRAHPTEWVDGSLWFICDMELDLDSFTATMCLAYQEGLGDNIRVLCFRREG